MDIVLEEGAEDRYRLVGMDSVAVWRENLWLNQSHRQAKS